MSISEFFTYLIAREPTRELGLQLAEVYDERVTPHVAVAGRR